MQVMMTKIGLTSWKKHRFPRKLKKKLSKSGQLGFMSRVLHMVNFGRFAAFETFKLYEPQIY